MRINYFLAFITLLFLTSCSDRKTENDVTYKLENIAYLESVTYIDGHSPNFFWKNPGGKLVDFKSLHKNVTLVNFWATWCSPCKKEIPDLIAINREFSGSGVSVIGISTDRGTGIIEEVGEFVKANNIDYQIIIDNGELSEAFGNVRGLPTTFLINRDGKIVKKFLGIKTKEFFIEQIREVLQ